MKSQIRQTVWCNVSDEAAGEIWNWSLLRVKGLMPTGLKKKTNWLSNENTTWCHSWRSCFKSNKECRSKGERAWLIFRGTADPTVETQNSIDQISRSYINVHSEECLKIHRPSVWCRGRGCGPGMKYWTCRAHVVPRHIRLRAHHSTTQNLSRPCPNGSLSVVNLSFGQTCECARDSPCCEGKKHFNADKNAKSFFFFSGNTTTCRSATALGVPPWAEVSNIKHYLAIPLKFCSIVDNSEFVSRLDYPTGFLLRLFQLGFFLLPLSI